MENKERYFSIANRLFWILIIIIIVFSILKFNPGIFKSKNLAKDIIRNDSLSKVDWDEKLVDVDSSKIKRDTSTEKVNYINKTWKWNDFKGRSYVMDFKIKKNDYESSTRLRSNSNKTDGDLYYEMYANDNKLLEDMINSYKRIIQSRGLNYMESMQMIVTSIQSIPYVLVSIGKCPESKRGLKYVADCIPHTDPSSCCSFVLPYGVYSPVEFAVQRTADCDTRSLFAYTILKKLGFDVAIINNTTHSVLGVNIPKIPGDGKTGSIGMAKKYYLWELTVYGPELGQNKDGNDWEIALN